MATGGGSPRRWPCCSELWLAFLSDLWLPKKTSLSQRHLATQLVNANCSWPPMSNDIPFKSDSFAKTVSERWSCAGKMIFEDDTHTHTHTHTHRDADTHRHTYTHTETKTHPCTQRCCVLPVSLLRYHISCAKDRTKQVHSEARSPVVGSRSIQTRLRINFSQCQTAWRLERGERFWSERFIVVS